MVSRKAGSTWIRLEPGSPGCDARPWMNTELLLVYWATSGMLDALAARTPGISRKRPSSPARETQSATAEDVALGAETWSRPAQFLRLSLPRRHFGSQQVRLGLRAAPLFRHAVCSRSLHHVFFGLPFGSLIPISALRAVTTFLTVASATPDCLG